MLHGRTRARSGFALALTGLAVLSPMTAFAQTSAPNDAVLAAGVPPQTNRTASATTAVRYPAYPVAKRIEPIVPPRTTPVLAAARKAMTKAVSAAAPKTARPTKLATKNQVRVTANPPLPGRQALGGPLPPAKPASAVKKTKAASKTAKR